ncbi:hypothetical protein PPHE_a3022 [Pseudoalteromonas phenolica O-BC30]|nr:hypothetical protein [Pseudoalteromonas phenolica O-BC30]TMO57285.1 hypothetical protein CWC21_05235 [Pseudoalteromonas phenolica]
MVLFSTIISPEVLINFAELEKNAPKQALTEYQRRKDKYQNTFNEDALQFHRIAIKAAINLYDWQSFTDIITTLKKKQFKDVTNLKAMHIINDIGVAYRQNNQHQDAIQHFTCALTQTTNINYAAAIKANIATAYRVQGQPSIGFRLLDSIEFNVLDANISTGIHIVRGNIALHIEQTDKALSYFLEAYKLFKIQNKHRDSVRLTFSILTTALIKKDLALYKKYRVNIENKILEYAINNHDYLLFLDEVEHAIAVENISSLKTHHISELVKLLMNHDDASENVRLLLESLNLKSLVPPDQKRLPKEPLLEPNLASPWCEGMK